MAQLPPDGEYLIQMIGDDVVLFQRHTEDEVVRFPAANPDAASKAQRVIHDSDVLDAEAKSMAHFWAGYFYGHATMAQRGIDF